MLPERSGPLTPAPGGGWRRDGAPWSPAAPFFAVVGDPVAHSLSPVMQGAALRARGLPHDYRAIEVAAGGLVALKQTDHAPGLAGFNVTAPLKAEAAGLSDELTPEAARVGAVNTVRVTGTRWQGHNTDLGGMRAALMQGWTAPGPPDHGTVLGTGGAARAAVLALLAWGTRRIAARARTVEGVRRFRGWLDGCGAPGAAAVGVDLLDGGGGPCPGETAVWLVSLPAGVPVAAWLPERVRAVPSLVLDLRYGAALPIEPRSPVPFLDGRSVLLAQGGQAFAWWFGEPVPWDAMRAALAQPHGT